MSAGILPFRLRDSIVQVLLVHPGGPFWRRRDMGAWSIAKGECNQGESPEAAARREFAEETGWLITGNLLSLGTVCQTSGKRITAFALEADFDPQSLYSNGFEMEWPPRSGHLQVFAEVDRAEWFDLDEARKKLVSGQQPLIDRLVRYLGEPGV